MSEVLLVLAVSAEQPSSEQDDSRKNRFWVLIQKWWVQASTVALVLILSYFLSRDGRVLATYVHITTEGAMQFLSGVSQALAALLALSLAFLIFEMEGVDRERNNAFGIFRSQMYKLFELTRSRAPDEMKDFDLALIAILDEFAHASREDLPLRFNQRSPEEDRWERLVQDLIKVSDSVENKRDIPELLYQRQVQVLLTIAEDALNRLQIQVIRAVASVLIIRLISKLALILGASLLLLLAFGTTDVRGVLPDLTIPLLFALLAWLLITLLELVDRARFYYSSFVGGSSTSPPTAPPAHRSWMQPSTIVL